ncbi:MAG: rod shape-determining protein MreC [Pseudomonadales bacterium]|nr:rod shape-determining protein MreC [Pseudomonadales bacterium]
MIALLVISSLVFAIESYTASLEPLRKLLATIVVPVYTVAELPYYFSGKASESIASRNTLNEENMRMRRRLLELSQITQQFISLREENARLRSLLGSQEQVNTEVLIAEIIGVLPSPSRHEVVLDKGEQHGVYVGQAVVDAHGLFGQVVEISASTSRVLQISDPSHAVPVQVNRTDLRMVAAGTGRKDVIELEYVPITADILPGDLLVSSGLGGRFPRGYPVGLVTSVVVDETQSFAYIEAKPSAALDRSRHVLLVFSELPGLTQ